ncbi:MAG: TetR/AcrR family transcriptional regulator [Kofleriaceae bacterium]|nr:TetR/AcrR family transcriptional regulator [Kofleriaceae bacterium]MCL4223403.1 TetR/AcrR family transcriptional regulator [Myxococcales bacterium]
MAPSTPKRSRARAGRSRSGAAAPAPAPAPALAIGTPRVPRRAVPQQRPGRPGGRRDEARRERVQALCAAAVRLFLERGIDGVRVEDITAAAGVAKGAFYYYFTDLEDLTASLFQPVAEATEAAFRRCRDGLAEPSGELTAVYQRLAMDLGMVLVQHLDVVRLYLQERRGPDRGPRRPLRAWARRLEEGAIWLTEEARRYRMMRDLPSAVVAHAVLGAAEQVMVATLAGDGIGDPAGAVRDLISLVLDGTRGR